MRNWMTGALVGLVACGAPAGDRAGTAVEDTAVTASQSPLASSLSVHVNGDSVRFRLDVTNPTTEPLVLEFGSAQRYDFAVESPDGSEVWRWSADMGFAQVVGSETLPAGETRSYEARWAHEERTGGYEAVAWLTSVSHPVELRTGFELVPE